MMKYEVHWRGYKGGKYVEEHIRRKEGNHKFIS